MNRGEGKEAIPFHQGTGGLVILKAAEAAFEPLPSTSTP